MQVSPESIAESEQLAEAHGTALAWTDENASVRVGSAYAARPTLDERAAQLAEQARSCGLAPGNLVTLASVEHMKQQFPPEFLVAREETAGIRSEISHLEDDLKSQKEALTRYRHDEAGFLRDRVNEIRAFRARGLGREISIPLSRGWNENHRYTKGQLTEYKGQFEPFLQKWGALDDLWIAVGYLNHLLFLEEERLAREREIEEIEDP